MSVSNEALQKLLNEIGTRAAVSQQQLQIVRGQITAKQREIRMLQITSAEIGSLPRGTRLYEGIGKMFVQEEVKTVQDRLNKEKSGLEEEIKALERKLQYLETTSEKAQDHIKAILQHG